MSTCRSCGAEVVFVPSVRGRVTMILDAVPEKRVVLVSAAEVVRYADEMRGPFYARLQDAYTDHHATCPDAKSWRGRSRKNPPDTLSDETPRPARARGGYPDAQTGPAAVLGAMEGGNGR